MIHTGIAMLIACNDRRYLKGQSMQHATAAAKCWAACAGGGDAPETVHELVGHANRARSTGSTGVNEDSSRSHSIMQVRAARASYAPRMGARAQSFCLLS